MTGTPSPADALAVTNAIHEYSQFIDDEQFERLGNLLADCAVYVDGRPAFMRDGRAVETRFAAAAAQARGEGRSGIRHFVANTVLTLEGADIVARSACLVVEAHGEMLMPTRTAGYVDRFRCSDGKWRFVERRIAIDNLPASHA